MQLLQFVINMLMYCCRNEQNQEALFNYSVGLLKDLLSPDGADILGIDLSQVETPEFGLPVPDNQRPSEQASWRFGHQKRIR